MFKQNHQSSSQTHHMAPIITTHMACAAHLTSYVCVESVETRKKAKLGISDDFETKKKLNFVKKEKKSANAVQVIHREVSKTTQTESERVRETKKS